MKFIISGPECLFESIDGFAKATNIIWPVFINESKRLHHINFVLECTLQESIIHIKLAESQVPCDINIKNSVYSSMLGNRAERLVEIYSWSLIISFCNQTRSAFAYGPIRQVFGAEEPATANGILIF